DETCAYAAKGLVAHVVTAEITVAYKKPVPLDTELFVSATVVGRRRKIIEVKGQIEIDGEIYAEASTKMFIVAGESP
ncbi:MAG: hotdog domain-containing protein, partial [Desulfuromonadales bacterium]|nr:hotdog domain-containing protein [Desulfuromonadales bacterium]